MSDVKTKKTTQDPHDFLSTLEPEQKRLDSLALLELFTKATGEKAVMWGASIVGFGTYHLQSEKDPKGNDWPLVGFSPRKQNLTLYIMDGNDGNSLLEKLGKHKTSTACLYINKLSDVDLSVLTQLIEMSFAHAKKKHT